MSWHSGAIPFSALDFSRTGKVVKNQMVLEIPGREPSENTLFDVRTLSSSIKRELKSYRANSTLFTMFLSEPRYSCSRGYAFEPAHLSLPG